jgi:hypothetical protein
MALWESTADVLEELFYVLGTAYCVWVLNSFRKAFPIRASMFDLGRSSWPTTEAVVTRAALNRKQPFTFLSSRRHYPFYIWFEYEIGGIKYRDVFTATAWASDRHLEDEVVGEKLMIRYNPRNLSDALPMEDRWHDLKVWWPGRVGGN